jgi:PIN domain nuclease of toxin-antitoxin system
VGRQEVKAVLLDTHAWAWSLTGDDRLSPAAVAAIEQAEAVFVSPISFFEIGQKVRFGKWPEMEPLVGELPKLLAEQGGMVAALEPETCLAAALLDWVHRDPFDRLLAATALGAGLPLVSADVEFDSLAGGKPIVRVW